MSRRKTNSLEGLRKSQGQRITPGQTTSSNYIPLLPDQLRETYQSFNRTLTPDQRKALGIHSEANPTGEIKPLHKEDECQQIDNWEQSTPPAGYSLSAWLDALQTTQPIEPEEQDAKAGTGYLHIIAVLSIIRRVLRAYEVSAQQDSAVRLHGECLALALSIPGYGDLTTVAKRHGVSKQAVSKRVRVISQSLALPPAYSKSVSKLPQAAIHLRGTPRAMHPRGSKRTNQPQLNAPKCPEIEQTGQKTGGKQRLTGVVRAGGARNLFTPPLMRGGGSKPTPKMGDGRFKNAKNPRFSQSD